MKSIFIIVYKVYFMSFPIIICSSAIVIINYYDFIYLSIRDMMINMTNLYKYFIINILYSYMSNYSFDLIYVSFINYILNTYIWKLLIISVSIYFRNNWLKKVLVPSSVKKKKKIFKKSTHTYLLLDHRTEIFSNRFFLTYLRIYRTILTNISRMRLPRRYKKKNSFVWFGTAWYSMQIFTNKLGTLREIEIEGSLYITI